MGLAEVARAARKEATSPEIAWLRQLRAFTEEWTDEKLIAEIEKIEAYSKTPEGRADQKKVYLDTLDILEKGSFAEFYRRVLKYAESKQRQDRHGGAEKAIKAHWEELQKTERGIRRRYEKQRAEEP